MSGGPTPALAMRWETRLGTWPNSQSTRPGHTSAVGASVQKRAQKPQPQGDQQINHGSDVRGRREMSQAWREEGGGQEDLTLVPAISCDLLWMPSQGRSHRTEHE